MQTKDFKFQLKDVDDQGTFIGLASTFGNKDLVGDVIEQGAFSRSINNKKSFPVLWNHDHNQPIGKILAQDMRETRKGLEVKGRLTLGVERAREVRDLMADEVLGGMSIGFQIPKGKTKFVNGIRHIKEVNLWEVSPVTFPANPMATITGVKSAEGCAIEECVEALRDLSAVRTEETLGRAIEKLEGAMLLLQVATIEDSAKGHSDTEETDGPDTDEQVTLTELTNHLLEEIRKWH